MIPNFDIANDLKVEMFLPDEYQNIFIIGVSAIGGTDLLAGTGIFYVGISLIGGTDVLGGGDSAFDWQQIECETSQAQISVGGTIISALYFQAEASTCNLTVQSWAFDPNNSSAVRPGTPIRVRLDDGVIDQVLFSGFLDTFTVAYRADGPNLITFSATDSFKRLVNTPIADFDTTGFPAGYATPNEVIEIAALNAGMTISTGSDELPGKLPLVDQENVQSATVINEALQVGLGVVWVNPETGEIELRNRPTVGITPPPGTLIIGNDHTGENHLCMSAITSTGDADNVFNSMNVYLQSDPLISINKTDIDSVELYGYSFQDVTLNTTDTDELTRWANAVFTQRPTKLVNSVTTPAIDRLGTLTEAAILEPGELVGVKYETDNIDIEDYYTTTKVSHNIDVNNWFTTLELWKEF
jgi:hypothetical protein